MPCSSSVGLSIMDLTAMKRKYRHRCSLDSSFHRKYMAEVRRLTEDGKSTSLFIEPKTSHQDICSSLPTPLQLLPAETILMISDLLPLSGIMVLSHTCRALSIKLRVSTQGVLGEPRIITNIPPPPTPKKITSQEGATAYIVST
ncbi:hypothetical protein N7G274_008559 [Stereocaulon virgatum]|uniref:F-box domain-containing protein n=1 Tax=Stereocaulon virgatum TaxID=373712 RepID=A0ABR4A0J2_9LECA